MRGVLWVLGLLATVGVAVVGVKLVSAHEEPQCPDVQPEVAVVVKAPAVPKPVKLRLVDVFACGTKSCRYEFVGPKDVFTVGVNPQ